MDYTDGTGRKLLYLLKFTTQYLIHIEMYSLLRSMRQSIHHKCWMHIRVHSINAFCLYETSRNGHN